MAVERYYIYRSGGSDACAVTGAKDDPPSAPSYRAR